MRETFEEGKLFFASLASASDVFVQADMAGIADDAVSVVISGANIYMPFSDLVDIEQEKARLAKEQDRLNSDINRAEGMLANERFISKAPQTKVDEEKEKLAKYRQMLDEVNKQIEKLNK